MDIQAIIQYLKELEALVDDSERAAFVLYSDGSGRIEMDSEECGDFYNTKAIPQAFDQARSNLQDWLDLYADER